MTHATGQYHIKFATLSAPLFALLVADVNCTMAPLQIPCDKTNHFFAMLLLERLHRKIILHWAQEHRPELQAFLMAYLAFFDPRPMLDTLPRKVLALSPEPASSLIRRLFTFSADVSAYPPHIQQRLQRPDELLGPESPSAADVLDADGIFSTPTADKPLAQWAFIGFDDLREFDCRFLSH